MPGHCPYGTADAWFLIFVLYVMQESYIVNDIVSVYKTVSTPEV
jgi:hypothetical protein